MNCGTTSRSAPELARNKTNARLLRKLRPAILLVVTAISSNFSSAGEIAPLGVEWRCVQQYDEFFHVQCAPKPTGFGSAALEASDDIVKASLPGAGELRPVAERGLAEVFSADAWSVPLYSRPRDMVMVNQLLQSVLCNTAPRCSVSYRSN
jgi:hypothetical protein